MSSVRVTVAISFLWICLAPCAFASYLPVPLQDRIQAADLVVLGTLGDIKPNYYHVTWFPGRPRGQGLGEYTSRFDEGRITIERFLWGTWHASTISLAFDQPNQMTHPFRHMLKPFSEGQRGIWIVSRGMSGSFEGRDPMNPLPVDSLQKVVAAIQRIRKEKGKRPRIIVRQAESSSTEYTAYIEGKSGWTKQSGRTEEEAVGRVLMLSWATSDLGVDVGVEAPRRGADRPTRR